MMAEAICMPLNLARAWVSAQRRAGDRVVLAHGAFDPLSIAHVEYLKAAATHGRRLVVLVQADTWPLAREKAALVAAIRCVDVVIPSGVGVLGVAQVIVDLNPDVFAVHGTMPGLHDFAAWMTERGIELAVIAAAAPAQEMR